MALSLETIRAALSIGLTLVGPYIVMPMPSKSDHHGKLQSS